MIKGTVYFHKFYTFPDGSSKPKFFIILHTSVYPSDPCIFNLTTSKIQYSHDTEGCGRYKNVYLFIPHNSLFDMKTWVKFEIKKVDKKDMDDALIDLLLDKCRV